MDKETNTQERTTRQTNRQPSPDNKQPSAANGTDARNGTAAPSAGNETSKSGSDSGPSVEQQLKDLNASRDGLSSDEAAKRLDQYGPNEIHEQKKHPLLKFLGYFWGPIPWMIEAAMILSAVIQHWEDFIIILVLLLLNAVIGFWQEAKADNAIELLKKKTALKARAKRDGSWATLPASELVPGDLIRVRLGDIVPADLTLTDGDYLSADESALTGESLPVEKHSGDKAFSGANIRQGEMDGLVTATGDKTYFGKTAQLLSDPKTRSHFQKAVVKIGDYLIVFAVVLVVFIFALAMFRNESLLDTLEFALVLTVAAIPVALPAVLSVTMAFGATRLAKRQAIVSRLVSIEEMAGMDVLCSDKTGTLTKNELTVTDIRPYGDSDEEEILYYAALASRAEDEDPIDSAIISAAYNKGGLKDRLQQAKVSDFEPFDPVKKRTQATIPTDSGDIQTSKGAVQVILELLEDDDAARDEAMQVVEDQGAKGYRSLAVGVKRDGPWQLAGIIALVDPPRDDTSETLNQAHDMGVTVKMVTGDHLAIAKQTASDIGIGTNIQLADTFANQSDRKARQTVEELDGFAQVFPEHKHEIVDLLQRNNHIVGMTGDGVNDAPALKKADVGIAVAGATEAAKSAAAIVLTTPGLSVIIDAIKESRKIFQRMTSYAIYRIAETIRVLLFITLAITVFNFYPVTAVMIVLLALFNDAPIMAIANDNVRYSNSPEKWNMREVLTLSTVLGVIGVFSSFGIFYIGEKVLHLGTDAVQSFIFLKLAVAGHLTLFLTRTRGPFWSIKPSGLLFWSAIVTKILATLVAVYGWFIAPIGWGLAGMVWGYALVTFVITDFLKIQTYKLLDHSDIHFASRTA